MNVTQTLPKVTAFLQRKHGCFIDGAWVVPEGARTDVLNPATGQAISSVADIDTDLLDQAVKSAHASF